mmetsp:Transcript_67536/g.162131  ORF Transcript_67536/g.162131 Transcript_67536/m.162131 type:complete len:682 (-) Transcript_67536:13-2058(-)
MPGDSGLTAQYKDGQMKFLQLMQEARTQHKVLMDRQRVEQEAFMERMVIKCQTILQNTLVDYVPQEDLEFSAYAKPQHTSIMDDIGQARGASIRGFTSSNRVAAHDASGGTQSQNSAGGSKDEKREPFRPMRSTLINNINDRWKHRTEVLLDHVPKSVRRSALLRWILAMARRMDRWMAVKEKAKDESSETRAAKIVHNPMFEVVSMTVILLNLGMSIYAADKTMSELSDDPTLSLFFMDCAFLAFYTLEVVLRLSAYKLYYFFNNDWVWNWFDACILFLGYADLVITLTLIQGRGTNPVFLRLLRVIRVTKAMRILRGVRFCWELQFFFDLVRKSFASFLWCAGVAAFFNLFFSLVLVQLSSTALIDAKDDTKLRDDVRDHFPSVAQGMLTLFQLVTGGLIWDEVYQVVRRTGDAQAVCMLIYLIAYQLGITNLVISMYVAKGSSLMKPVEDDLSWQAREDGFRLAHRMEEMIARQASFIPGKMTEEEFSNLLQEPEMVDMMTEHRVSQQDAMTLFSALMDADGSGSCEVAAVVEGFTRMRGNASSLDMLTLMYEVRVQEKDKSARAERAERKLDMMTRALALTHVMEKASASGEKVSQSGIHAGRARQMKAMASNGSEGALGSNQSSREPTGVTFQLGGVDESTEATEVPASPAAKRLSPRAPPPPSADRILSGGRAVI